MPEEQQGRIEKIMKDFIVTVEGGGNPDPFSEVLIAAIYKQNEQIIRYLKMIADAISANEDW